MGHEVLKQTLEEHLRAKSENFGVGFNIPEPTPSNHNVHDKKDKDKTMSTPETTQATSAPTTPAQTPAQQSVPVNPVDSAAYDLRRIATTIEELKAADKAGKSVAMTVGKVAIVVVAGVTIVAVGGIIAGKVVLSSLIPVPLAPV